MNDLVTLKYGGKDVRIEQAPNGALWFLAQDVCEQLGYGGNTSNTIKTHCRPEGVAIRSTPTTGGNQKLLWITERNLYRLIMRSKLASAEKFQDWVEEDVLPTIRKTGGYSLVPKTLPEALRAYAIEIEKNEELNKILVEAKPKVEFFDQVADSKDAIDIGTVAKVLNCGIGRNDLFQLLRDKGILMSTNIPYQAYIDREYFRTIEQKYTVPDGSTHISIKTLAYQKGVDYIRKIALEYLKKEGL